MTVFNVLSLIGGLALFLFGMNVMGQALEEAAGPRLKSILESMTGNPFKGLLLGLGVTAVIQSSSATTVMAVGFVNSGIMELKHAIGVIMGANVGTTVTAWLISLTGIQGDSLVMQLLKPTSFTPLLALAGVVIMMAPKLEEKKDIGRALLGFAVLMSGMDTMSAAVKPLSNSDAFMNLFVLFQNPILGVLAGALLTAIIQSSSASVGILQALSSTGGVTFGSAIPIIMGQNIGTCVTAMISSIGTNKNARRTALVHLYFNIIGTVVCLIAFTAVNWFMKFAFVNDSINVFWIAVIHSVFNIICVVILFPFRSNLEKLAIKTVPDTGEEKDTVLLDERLFSTPSVAAERCRQIVCDMAELVRLNFFRTIAMIKGESVSFKEISKTEDAIDEYEDQMSNYLVKLSSYSLSTQDSRLVSRWFHGITDFERIGDHLMNIAEHLKYMSDHKQHFSDMAKAELSVMAEALSETVDRTLNAYIIDDYAEAGKIEALEQVIDLLDLEMKDSHIKRLREGLCSVESGFAFDEILTDMERISDHCSNLAICQLSSKDENVDMHKYRSTVKDKSNTEFYEVYNRFKEKYSLPK